MLLNPGFQIGKKGLGQQQGLTFTANCRDFIVSSDGFAPACAWTLGYRIISILSRTCLGLFNHLTHLLVNLPHFFKQRPSFRQQSHMLLLRGLVYLIKIAESKHRIIPVIGKQLGINTQQYTSFLILFQLRYVILVLGCCFRKELNVAPKIAVWNIGSIPTRQSLCIFAY
ncbi:hypothetical protein D3C77_490140 [compost metagenome]